MIQLGVDLGTTNTSLALSAAALELSGGGTFLPSVVAFPPGGSTLIGDTAKRRRAIDPRNTISSSKRLMGCSWSSAAVGEFRRRYATVELAEKDGHAAFVTRLGTHSPTEIATLIVRNAVQGALEFDPHQIRAVVTVPVTFSDAQRTATAEALRQTGFREVAVQQEPTATAAAYLSRGATGIVAVYDLGGGSFDFSVMDCSSVPFRSLASSGEPFLGGDDIDRALAQWAAEEFLTKYRWDLRSDVATFDRLVVACERAKIRLSYARETTIDLAQVDPAAPVAPKLPVGRALLEQLALGLVQRTFVVCDETLEAAGLRAEQIDAVLMAGGGASSPMVWSAVRDYFKCAPRCEFSPMQVVAIGASITPEPVLQ